MTPQSLDAVVALVPVEPTDHMLNEGSMCHHLGDTWAAMLAAAPDWHPTPEAINALPQPLRDYIHTIQTSHPSYDNAVKVKRLEERVAMLERALGEAEKDSRRWDFLRHHAQRIEWVDAGATETFEWNTEAETVEDSDWTLDAAIDDAMAALPEPPQSEER